MLIKLMANNVKSHNNGTKLSTKNTELNESRVNTLSVLAKKALLKNNTKKKDSPMLNCWLVIFGENKKNLLYKVLVYVC
jgi:hypothetical protein